MEGYRHRPNAARLALVTGLVAVGVCFREIVLVVACAAPFVGHPVPTTRLRVAVASADWRTA